MIYTLIVMTSLMMLVAAFHQIVSHFDKAESARVEDRRAFYLAEAGLAEAMAAMRAGNSGAVGSQGAPAYQAGGILWVDATDLGDDQTELVVTAMAGGGRAALRAVILDEGGAAPIFQTVLNSDEQLTLSSNVVIDSFDSEAGDYLSQALEETNGHLHANTDGNVSSNEWIFLNAQASVFGDAIPGPGYNVSFAADSYVDGAITPASMEFSFPPVEIPAIPRSEPLPIPNGDALTLTPGNYGYTNLTIGKEATLTIQGPATLVLDDFEGGKDANLVIDATNGPVTIHVEGNYTHTSGFETSAAVGSPLAVAFMIQGTDDIAFPSGTNVRGGYYVPNANVTLDNSNEVWGALAAKRIEMSAGTHFHFDEALSRHWEEDINQGGEDPLHVLMWAPVQVTPGFLRSKRRDPIDLLNLDAGALRSPAGAWDIEI